MRFIINFIKWTYDIFTRPAAKIGLGVLVAGGFVAGALFWHMFNLGMDKTNEEQFCLSCHTMEDNLLPELQKTVHWQNRSGVRARCPDCHVPHEFTDKVARKMQASREVLAHITGTIGTREKFKEHRIVLAQREWARFKANNSKECRNCHDYNSMDFSKMRVTSQMIMRSAAERDASCVDCHRGIAHSLPDLQGSRNPAFDTLMSEARSVSVESGVTYYSAAPQDLFADEGLTQKLGSLEVATPVRIVEVKGDVQKIELDLWRKNKGFGRVLNSEFGLNITSAILEKTVSQDPALIEVLEAKVDDLTGLEWQKVAVQGWVSTGAVLNSPETIWNIARTSYQNSCSVCHRQPVESGHDTNQWPGLFAGMVGFTNMDADTSKLVLKYLQMHSSDFATGSQAPGSPESTVQSARP
ncbi:pentaheme c-type cytochrome TorC [Advenella sp. WQ 585]|uniref:Cytochrome c-type protein n=1 Tax=Advenella mandrilli TaxID=2800330 RepID=A0ABS1EE16_9BURK|nr:pentaheme c-type cytochrome TorC [Advenella mandrilli]MBK1780929.1 pentaheme c-type cytochrome TorC [Advenella mandrilli]